MILVVQNTLPVPAELSLEIISNIRPSQKGLGAALSSRMQAHLFAPQSKEEFAHFFVDEPKPVPDGWTKSLNERVPVQVFRPGSSRLIVVRWSDGTLMWPSST